VNAFIAWPAIGPCFCTKSDQTAATVPRKLAS
jgi:hypothetical protein